MEAVHAEMNEQMEERHLLDLPEELLQHIVDRIKLAHIIGRLAPTCPQCFDLLSHLRLLLLHHRSLLLRCRRFLWHYWLVVVRRPVSPVRPFPCRVVCCYRPWRAGVNDSVNGVLLV